MLGSHSWSFGRTYLQVWTRQWLDKADKTYIHVPGRLNSELVPDAMLEQISNLDSGADWDLHDPPNLCEDTEKHVLYRRHTRTYTQTRVYIQYVFLVGE